MLVVAANLAISDGTLVTHARRRQHAWLAAVHRAAIRAGWRRDGGYRPIARLDIVLAGDTFDGLTSVAWSGDVRPWQAGSRAADASRSTRLGALHRGRWLLAGLRGWTRAGLPVPGVDRRGRPLPRLESRVPVQVTLLAGDRDGWLDGAAGLAERHGFTVGSSWTDGLVSVRHGDLLDPLCGGQDDRSDAALAPIGAVPRRPTLAETVAVGLVSRFGYGLMAVPGAWPVGRSLVEQLTVGLPAEMPGIVARWQMHAIQQQHVSAATATAITRCWDGSVAAWFKEARALEPRCGHDVDGLALVATALAADGRVRPSLTAAAALTSGGTRTRPDPEAADVGITYSLAARPAVLVLGHRLGSAGSGPRLLCLADMQPGPVTVCCHRDRQVLRVDVLDQPDAASLLSRSCVHAAPGDRDGLIVDAA